MRQKQSKICQFQRNIRNKLKIENIFIRAIKVILESDM